MFNHPNRNFGLDVIRAVAIILVITSHCTYLIPESDSQLIVAVRTFGAIGVDLFFVLSGYLIGGILLKYIEKGHTSFKYLFHFWKRRWMRTLPNYFVVLIFNCFLIFLLGSTLIPEAGKYFLFLQNFSSPHPDFFTEAWSLSVEEFAYLTLPFILFLTFFITKQKNKKQLFFLLSLFTIIVLFLLKFYFYFTHEFDGYKDWSSSFRKVVIYRIDSIYIGFIMIYCVSQFVNFIKKYHWWLFGTGFLIFIGLHGFILVSNALPETYPLYYTIIYLPLLCVSLALAFPSIVRLPHPKIGKQLIYYISTRSYAIYLVNFSLILLTLQKYYELSLWLIPIFLVSTIIVSELLYCCIEKPFLRLRENYASRL